MFVIVMAFSFSVLSTGWQAVRQNARENTKENSKFIHFTNERYWQPLRSFFTKRAVAFDIWFTSIAFPNALSHKQKYTTKTWCLFFRCWNALRPPPPHSIHLQLYPSLSLFGSIAPHIMCLFCTSRMSCRLWTSIEQLKTIKEFKRQFSWLGRNFRKSLNAISGNFAGSVRRKFALRITFKFYRRMNASENK